MKSIPRKNLCENCTDSLFDRGRNRCAEKYKCIEFDDNGPFGVLPSTFHVFLGFTVCRALIQSNSASEKIKRMLCWGILYGLAGLILDVAGLIPISKNMWSLSFCLWTSGVASLLLCVLYVWIDCTQCQSSRLSAFGFSKWKGGILRMLGQNSLGL